MDLLSVGLEVEDKGSEITVGKGLGIELNKRGTTWLGFAELGAAQGVALGLAPCAALDAALGDAGGAASWAALGASPCAASGAALGTTPGAALGAALGIASSAASDGAIGMVLERIEVEEGESLMPID